MSAIEILLIISLFFNVFMFLFAGYINEKWYRTCVDINNMWKEYCEGRTIGGDEKND